MSEKAIYVFKEFDDDITQYKTIDNLVKKALGLTTSFDLPYEELKTTLSESINILETFNYLKFKKDKEYDAQAQRHKTVFYYIVNIDKEKNDDASLEIKVRSDNFEKSVRKKQDEMPKLIEDIITLCRQKNDNEFTTFEEIYRDYKNKHREKDMLDYTSAKIYFFQDNFSLNLQDMRNDLDESYSKDEEFFKKMLLTPYELFLDTLAVYLIESIKEIPSFFKKLKNKKKSIRKLSHKVKSKIKSKIVEQIKSKFFIGGEKHNVTKGEPISSASSSSSAPVPIYIKDIGKKLEKNKDFSGKFIPATASSDTIDTVKAKIQLYEKFTFYKTKKQKLPLDDYNWYLDELTKKKFIKEFEYFIFKINNRHSLEYKLKIIKIIFNLIFNKYSILKDNDEKSEEFIIFQEFLNHLNIVIPNFDKIMIKDRDKNPFFLMYFLCKKDIYVELHCSGKVYKINNCPSEKKPIKPYKIRFSECYSNPLILQIFDIQEDDLTATTVTPYKRISDSASSSGSAMPSQPKSIPRPIDESKTEASDVYSINIIPAKPSTKINPDTSTARPSGDVFNGCNELLTAEQIKKLPQIDAVIYHQCLRFKELDKLLQGKDVTVVIAGKSGRHALGTGLAVNAWGGPEKPDYIRMQSSLDYYVKYLKQTYKEKVIFGNVGQVSKNKAPDYKKTPEENDKAMQFNVKQDPDKNYINVYGANEKNWNLKPHEKMTGDEQAGSFDTMEEGVFGISTMPPSNNSNLFDFTKYAPGGTIALTPSPYFVISQNTTPLPPSIAVTPIRPGSKSPKSPIHLASHLTDDDPLLLEKYFASEIPEIMGKKLKFFYYGAQTKVNLKSIEGSILEGNPTKNDYHDGIQQPSVKELKKLIISNLSEKKYLIRWFSSDHLIRFIYLTDDIKNMSSFLVTKDNIDEKLKIGGYDQQIIKMVFDTIEPISSFKSKKSILKKPTAKKSLLKKSSSKKNLLKKPTAKKSLLKKPTAKKSLLKKPTAKKSF